MKVESLIRTDKEDWSKLYHGYANFYKMPMNSDILDTVWDWIFNPDIKFYAIGIKSEQEELIGFMHFRNAITLKRQTCWVLGRPVCSS